MNFAYSIKLSNFVKYDCALCISSPKLIPHKHFPCHFWNRCGGTGTNKALP